MAPRKSPPDNRRDDGGFKAAAKVVVDYVQELEKARTVSKHAADAQEALKEAFPAVGGLITAFKSPLIGVVEVGRHLITSTVEGIKKMMDGIGEDVSFGKLTEVFRQQKRAIEDAGTSAKLYAKRLSEIGQATDTPTGPAEKSVEALQKQKAAQDQLAKEQLRADRARISREEINPIERDRKLKQAEESFVREKAVAQNQWQRHWDAEKSPRGVAEIHPDEEDPRARTEKINPDRRRQNEREELVRHRSARDTQSAVIAGRANEDKAAEAPGHYQIKRTDLESKGFVLNGFAVTDTSALKTADNTTIMVAQLMTLIELHAAKTANTITNDHAN